MKKDMDLLSMNIQSNGKTPPKWETWQGQSRMLFGVIITIVITEFGPSLDQASFFSPVGN